MTMTLADVARLRLVSQGLVEPWESATAAVAAFGCTQGQDFPGSTMSVALRTRECRVAGVHAAYDQGEIVRSWPMRGTLFVVAAADLGWMLALTGPKVIGETARRRAQLGLTDTQLDKAADLADVALRDGGLTRAALLSAFGEGGHDVEGGRGYHTLFHLAVRGLLCQGPVVGKEQLWVRVSDWVRDPLSLTGDSAVAEWLRRYLASHGPVPVADFHWWTKLLKRDVAPVLAGLRSEFAQVSVDGVEYWFSPDLLDRAADLTRALTRPLLLPGFDELVLGYGDRRAALSREDEALICPGGNGVFRPTVVRAGRVLGTWRKPTRKNAPVTVEPFAPPLSGVVERALPALTQALPA